MFDDQFLDNLPQDPIEALIEMCSFYFDTFDDRTQLNHPDYKDIQFLSNNDLIETYAAFQGLIESYKLPFNIPALTNEYDRDCSIVYNMIVDISQKAKKRNNSRLLTESREKYRIKFGSQFMYEFTDGDLNRIQELINELRDKISSSDLFEPNHKDRILNKLEKLQSELHKRMSTLEKFWGLFPEAGIALGKFGKNAKPFIDMIEEILKIAWRTQARAEELASDSPFPLLSDNKPE